MSEETKDYLKDAQFILKDRGNSASKYDVHTLALAMETRDLLVKIKQDMPTEPIEVDK